MGLKTYKYQIVGGLVLGLFLGVGNKSNITAGQTAARDLPSIKTRHQSRHANELFAKEKEAFKPARKDLRPFILKTVRKSLPKKHKHLAFEIAHTVITEANHYKMDPLFLLAVIETESQFRPDARGTSGEIGLMQILPRTAEWLAEEAGFKKEEVNLRDPAVNIRIGATYFNMLRKDFNGKGRLYVSAYNMGPRNVRKLLAKKVQPKEYSNRVIGNYTEFYQTVGRRLPAAMPTRHAAGLAQK